VFFVGVFTLLASGLAACATGATPGPPAPVTAVVEATVAAEATEPPAEAPTEAAAAETATGQVDSGTSPTALASVAPPTTAEPTPAPVDPRVLELEWPARMTLGDSGTVRLSLMPDGEDYVLVTEQPGGNVVTNTLAIDQLTGYAVFAEAELLGVNFEVTPSGPQTLRVNAGQPVTWRWTFLARDSGQHTLTLSLRLRWVGAQDQRESQAYTRSLPIDVWWLPGPGWVYTGVGLIGLVTGSGLSLLAWMLGRRAARPAARANPRLSIEAPANVRLDPAEQQVVRTAFGEYQRLVIEREFQSGYSGARALLALPVRADGRSDAHAILKIGPRVDVEREFRNYETFVKNTLPPMTARIQQAPVSANGWAGLRYTFIAEPGQRPLSLREALLRDPDPAPILKLFDTFAPNWWSQRKPYTFRLQVEYDRLLPPHLFVEPVSGNGPARGLDWAQPIPSDVQVGEVLNLGRLPTVQARADGCSYTLTAEAGPGLALSRVRWRSAERPRPGRVRVVETRASFLRTRVPRVDLAGWPDPIACLPDWLGETIAGGQSIIHGDLNLENVLVGPGGFVWLIDFAETREGHAVFDAARLLVEVIAHVVAHVVTDVGRFRALFVSALDRESCPDPALAALLTSLIQTGRRCQAEPARTREYDLAAAVAALSALKFDNLGPHARTCLYLAAAAFARRLQPSATRNTEL
jgi:hypothetical protein